MAVNGERIKVALLTGGDSSERAVCFMSAKAMANALPAERFAVSIYDVSSLETRRATAGLAEEALGKKPRHVIVGVEWNQLISQLYTTGFDVVLPALHGGWGEDGTLQALLEVAGIPYTGSRGHASALAIDKQACKAVLAEHGLPIVRGKVLWSLQELHDAPADAFFRTGPCVVKPNGGGSSVATTILREIPDQDTLATALKLALADGSGALIEEFIAGQEITAAVLGEGQSAQVLPLIEIVPRQDLPFYDFTAKYEIGGSQHLTPPRLGEDVQRQISEYALRAHRALGCGGVARSDYIVTPEGTAYFLEVNTLPGMTETSLVPDAARAAGIEFGSLVETLIESALRR